VTITKDADTDRVRLRVAVRDAESVTRTVNVEVPAAVGVPEIAPPDDNANPGGNDPASSDHR
jgi:hypothetical protein